MGVEKKRRRLIAVGQVYISVHSRKESKREWRIERYMGDGRWLLVPLGDDVRLAQDEHGRMQGGVRRITRGEAMLLNRRHWKLVRDR